ncbi:MAG: hypothetical protein LBR79_04175 [Oscillospiraceae bacterium]|jgi:hypothetical protein|nr:hypothetical protein [Oscillospiraceae bacterium]
MIELENLNNQPIEDILDEAKKQIIYLNSDWTNHQESDPGITLLELFVWLKSVQHEYLNRILPGVKHKFLNLLDIHLKRNAGAITLLEISDIAQNIVIPKGTRWKTNNMIFENINQQMLINSGILSVEFDNPGFATEEEYYKFDGSRIFHLFGENFSDADKYLPRTVTINFSKELPSSEVINLYFDIFSDNKNISRNEIPVGSEFDEIASVKWEYYGAQNEVLGWHPINVVKDYTHCFLFTGIVRLRINGKMEPLDGVYSIRFSLVKNEYDFPPKIKNIIPNVFYAKQGITKCDNIIVKKKHLKEDFRVEISSHVFIYGNCDVYIKKFGGWVETKNFTVDKNIDGGIFTLKIDNVEEIIENYSYEDEFLLIVAYDKDIQDKIILGSGTGSSAQFFEFRYQNVLYDGAELLIGEEKDDETVFHKWTRVDNFFSSKKYDRHYVLDERKKAIIFGDHHYGMAPRFGKNNVRFCKLVFCDGEHSNINQGMINKVETENQVLKESRIFQICSAVGGRDNETVERAVARAAVLFSDCGRAITAKDYTNVVKNTPGLMFQNVKVLPNYMPGEDCTKQNCTTIAVRWNDKVGLPLPKSYENNIMRQINKYRLINTKVKVVGPEYIGLIITGEIIVKSFYRPEDKLIEKYIQKFVKKVNFDLGKIFYFGDLFGELDKLDYVSYLEKLRITPIGNYVEKTVSEDIIVPPNGVYYVDKIDLNYIKSSEIYGD